MVHPFFFSESFRLSMGILVILGLLCIVIGLILNGGGKRGRVTRVKPKTQQTDV